MSAFQYLKSKISLFFREDLWDDDQLPENQNLKRFLLKPLRVGVMVSKGFYRHECFTRATSLTYVTLLSMIPLLAIAFAVLSYYATEHSSAIEKYLQDFFAPAGAANGIASEKANQFVQGIMGFVKNINFKQFKLIGLAFLFLSAISLISSIEYSFNHIWGIKRGRSFIKRVGAYSIVLLVLPFFIAITLSLSTSYQLFTTKTSGGVENTLSNFKGNFYLLDLMVNVSNFAIHHLGVLISQVLQFLFAWLLFTLLYYYLPYTKVKVYFSMKGGLITAILFELAKPLFTGYVTYFLSKSPIGKMYGALSFIPVSFLWIYIVWVIVLLGAEMTYAFQNVKAYQNEFRINRMNRKSKDLIVLKMVKEMLSQQRWNLQFTVEGLSERFNLPMYFVESSVSLLIEGGIVVEDANTSKIKVVDETITPGQVMIAMYNAGKTDSSDLKYFAVEIDEQLNNWESILASTPSKFGL